MPDKDTTVEITRLLARLNDGDQDAAEPLLTQVYAELRRLARGQLGRVPSQVTLQPTALVHEAYLRLFAMQDAPRDREHFLAIAAMAMRQILADHARRRRRRAP